MLARRALWERIVSGTTATRILAGDEAGAAVAFAGELRTSQLTQAAAGAHGTGEVYLIGAGPGGPGPADPAGAAVAAAGHRLAVTTPAAPALA